MGFRTGKSVLFAAISLGVGCGAPDAKRMAEDAGTLTTSLANANALIRVLSGAEILQRGSRVDFIRTERC